MDPRIISELEAAGVTSVRINLSHTRLADLEPAIRFIRSCTRLPICLDTEGAQLRTGVMKPGVMVTPGSKVRLVAQRVTGDAHTIPLIPGDALQHLVPATRMSVDFDSVMLHVNAVSKGVAEATVTVGGEVGTHKAVTALPTPSLAPLSEKDILAIMCGVENGVEQYALSFCDGPAAVGALRAMVGPERTIIAKIESREGVRNLAGIAQVADSLLIDRGDLSREVRLEVIPLLQKAIIRKANALGIPVYVATNLLESMVAKRAPTRAEVNDVVNTLLDGADGLVLASETAIGRYPVQAARMIVGLMEEYERSVDGYRIDDLLGVHPLAYAATPGEATLPSGPSHETERRPSRSRPPLPSEPMSPLA